MAVEALTADISHFIELVVDENLANGDMVLQHVSQRQEVVAALNERDDGMFLLVVFQIKLLSSLRAG
ncbi:hypothetical protein Micbo1qcDRAFT_203501 [Microdochium bolleyi]|uniref:Uncharacterized protein n=1 Tax=Microdochium bolleyi TaxID=196109 RepID=A0A136J8F3_9PEZI|nr:hypothetical protein Micbo1qcDRAFT_203501 [Microdochium bolleyi]